MSKSIWKLKLYSFNNIKLLNYTSFVNYLQIESKPLLLNGRVTLRVVNRFVRFGFCFKVKHLNLSVYNGKFFFIVKFRVAALIRDFKYGDLGYTRRMGLIHKEKKKHRLKKTKNK